MWLTRAAEYSPVLEFPNLVNFYYLPTRVNDKASYIFTDISIQLLIIFF